MFVYPFVKSRAWYALPADERWRIMQGHIQVGREYPASTITRRTRSGSMTRSSWSRSTPTTSARSSTSCSGYARPRPRRFTVRDTPSFTCLAMSVPRALNALDGEPVSFEALPALSNRGLAQLRRTDPVMAGLIAAVGKLGDAGEGRPDKDDHYGALVRTITGQQLSVLAARAIYGRLTARFGGRPPTPQEILADEPEALRAAAGLSRAKVSYLRSLAEHVLSGELELERLDALEDEEVIAELTAVKGLGLWTAQMFLMFHLDRPDVLPVGDLGIRRAIERAYGLDGLPDAAAMEVIAAPWRPHRTLACRYLWRSLANEPA